MVTDCTTGGPFPPLAAGLRETWTRLPLFVENIVRAHLVPVLEHAIRLCVVVMPLACWPVMVVRVPGLTLIHMEARASRVENAAALVEQLTPDEQVAVRLAYGMEPEGPLPEWTSGTHPALLWVPPSLRRPGDPALQGGAELDRRRILGDLEMELACLAAEQVVVTESVGSGGA